jgi:hypothetical protein
VAQGQEAHHQQVIFLVVVVAELTIHLVLQLAPEDMVVVEQVEQTLPDQKLLEPLIVAAAGAVQVVLEVARHLLVVQTAAQES